MQKILSLIALALLAFSPTGLFDNSAQTLPFTQDWTNTTMIMANDNWSGVPGIEGFLGQDITTVTGTDPQTLLTTSLVANDLDVIANQTNPNTLISGGVAEFDGISNPSIALQGSGTADAPHIIINLNTLTQSNILVAYDLRDLDGSADNAVQPVALQYRIGNTGNFTNIPSGFVADATTGPSLATLVTHVSAQLPGACDNQALVQLRIITSNAANSDEWVGIDNISITLNTGNALPIVTTSGGNTQYIHPTPIAIDAALTVADGNNTTLASGSVSITGNFQSGQDVLSFASGAPFGNITGSYTAGTGVLALSSAGATATLAEWQAALRSITYNNTSGSPNTSNRTISFQVNDGTDNSGLATKVVAVSPAAISIHDVQGSGNTSPFNGTLQTVTGIVTGLRSNGFFLQTPTTDADPNTSEGIFVFTSSTPPVSAAIGNLVQVTGTIAEFIPTNDPNSPSQTEITGPTVVVQLTGNPLPSPVVLTTGDTDPTGTIYQLEKYEGMRVQINTLTVVSPTEGTLSEPNATSTSTGYFYGVITGISRPFREPGVQLPDALPGGSPANVPRWDANPEVIGVDTRAQSGGTLLDVSTAAVVTNIVGPLDFNRRFYTIDVDNAPTPGLSNNALTFTSVPASANSTVSIASMNLQRFYDETDDLSTGDVVLTNTAFTNRMNKLSLAVRNVLNLPDILGVEEAENLTTLQAIAIKINADVVASAQPDPVYTPYLVEGNDGTGIDVGFLVKSTKVGVVTATQTGKATTYIDPNTGNPATLFDRPPLLLFATFTKPGCGAPIPFTVIMNHSLSMASINDATLGNRVRTKRRAQAEYMANLIQTRQINDPAEKIISIGDYNAYEFNDGYVDVLGTIKGTPVPADQVVLASGDLVNPDLINLTSTYTAAQRYTYVSAGNASALDHILITQNLNSQVSSFSIARMASDFAEIIRNDASRPERITDHDVPVAYFNFACPASTSPNHYFRTKQTGNWNDVNTWESSSDNVNWINATLTPDFNAVSITVRSPHVINVTANVTVAHLTLDAGSTVNTNTGVNFTVQ